MNQQHIEIIHNQDEQQYEAHLDDGSVAVLTYTRQGDRIIYTHTGVPLQYQNRGIANQLTHTALEDAREQQLTIVPACTFVAAYVRRHPEYQELLTERSHS